MEFEQEYFKRIEFGPGEIQQHWDSACRDLTIAENDEFAEVRFSYSYQALLKAGIALIAHIGSVKVRSARGHHVKILQKMSEILNNDDVQVIGDSMRRKRNNDFYGGGQRIGRKEADDYLRFVKGVMETVREKLGEFPSSQ